MYPLYSGWTKRCTRLARPPSWSMRRARIAREPAQNMDYRLVLAGPGLGRSTRVDPHKTRTRTRKTHRTIYKQDPDPEGPASTRYESDPDPRVRPDPDWIALFANTSRDRFFWCRDSLPCYTVPFLLCRMTNLNK